MSTTEVEVLPALSDIDITIPQPERLQDGIGRRRGLFITFEGIDGSGKSTQLKLLAERLRAAGHEVLETAEPGGTDIGVQIRRILLDSANRKLCAAAELLLMFAARAQNVEEYILPALDQGRIVLCDRFTDSTVVYQGIARGLGLATVLAVDAVASRGLTPDLTLYIDIDVETGLARAHTRDLETPGSRETRMEEEALDFHRRVWEGYQELANREPDRVRRIDGASDPESVAAEIWRVVSPAVAAR